MFIDVVQLYIMKYIKVLCSGFILFSLLLFGFCSYQADEVNSLLHPTTTPTLTPTAAGYIIADHTACTLYTQIPAVWLAKVKSMTFWYTGESHSYQIKGGRDDEGIMGGMELLEAENSLYAVEVQDKPSEFLESGVLRLIRGNYTDSNQFSNSPMGEEFFWSSQKVRDLVKHAVETNPIDVACWCWCWDIGYNRLFQWDANKKAYVDIIPDPDGRWQPEHMQIYLDAFTEFNANPNASTIFIYQTAVTDNPIGENAYRTQLLNDQIRAWVKAKGAVLFDWADIETHSPDGTVHNLATWTDTTGIFGTAGSPYTFEVRHSAWNKEELGHAARALAVQKAKAMWWLLARLAGWDGKS
jgi:hypothetical protein